MHTKTWNVRPALWAAVIAAPLAIAVVQPARAADPAFSAQLGGAFPTTESGRSAFGTAGVHVEFGYSPHFKSLLSPSHGRPQFEFQFDRLHTHATLNSYGLFYSERVRLSKHEKGSSKSVPYAGFGVGGMLLDAWGDNGPGGGGGTGGGGGGELSALSGRGIAFGSDHVVRPAGKFILGAEFAHHTFLEASYVLVGTVGNRHADSLNLSYGLRF
jgi:hypothetical protein